jgi:hypothetical protein
MHQPSVPAFTARKVVQQELGLLLDVLAVEWH